VFVSNSERNRMASGSVSPPLSDDERSRALTAITFVLAHGPLAASIRANPHDWIDDAHVDANEPSGDEQ
jgi:hypothetical protein